MINYVINDFLSEKKNYFFVELKIEGLDGFCKLYMAPDDMLTTDPHNALTFDSFDIAATHINEFKVYGAKNIETFLEKAMEISITTMPLNYEYQKSAVEVLTTTHGINVSLNEFGIQSMVKKFNSILHNKYLEGKIYDDREDECCENGYVISFPHLFESETFPDSEYTCTKKLKHAIIFSDKETAQAFKDKYFKDEKVYLIYKPFDVPNNIYDDPKMIFWKEIQKMAHDYLKEMIRLGYTLEDVLKNSPISKDEFKTTTATLDTDNKDTHTLYSKLDNLITHPAKTFAQPFFNETTTYCECENRGSDCSCKNHDCECECEDTDDRCVRNSNDVQKRLKTLEELRKNVVCVKGKDNMYKKLTDIKTRIDTLVDIAIEYLDNNPNASSAQMEGHEEAVKLIKNNIIEDLLKLTKEEYFEKTFEEIFGGYTVDDITNGRFI